MASETITAETLAKTSALHQVKRLEEQEDWPEWSKQMRNYLIMNGYNSILVKQTETPDRRSEEADTAYEARVEAWEDRQARALAAIRDRCGYNAEAIVHECATIKKAFEELQSNYQPSGSGEYDRLCSRFNDIALSVCSGVGNFGSELRKIWEQMRAIDKSVALPEAFVVQKFLYGLGSEFTDFRTSFNLHYTIVPMTVAGKTQDAVTLKRTVAAAEEFEARNLKTEGSKVFLARTSSEKRASTGFKRKQCPHCGNIHGRDCWKLDDRNAPEWWKQRADLQDRLAPPKRRRGEDNAGVTRMGPRGSQSPEQGYSAVLLTSSPKLRPTLEETCLFKNNAASGEAMTVHRGTNLWDAWILDTGASGHLVGRKDVFVQGTFETLNGVVSNGIGGAQVTPIGKGTIRILCKSNDSPHWLEVPNVQYSPQAGVNLLSLNSLWPFIDRIEKLPNGLAFSQGKQRFSASISENLMMLDMWKDPMHDFQGAAYSIEDPSMRLWHERMGHLSESGLRRLRHIATGMDDTQEDGRCMCESCVKGRMTERPHTGVIAPGRHALDLIHTDVAGPIKVTGHDQTRYWVTCLDDFTQWAEVELLQHQSQAFSQIRGFIERNELPERRCRRIRLDRGGENVSREFILWAYDKGIELEYTDTEQHQANGCAEALNRILENKLHPTLLSSGLADVYWPPVVKYGIAYVRNRSPSSRIKTTPYEMWTGTKPDLSNIRKIGSQAFVLNPQRARHKVVGTKASEGRLLGFKGRYTYLIKDKSGKLDWRTNVVFKESRPHIGVDGESFTMPEDSDTQRHPSDLCLLEPSALAPVDVGGQDDGHRCVATPASVEPDSVSQEIQEEVCQNDQATLNEPDCNTSGEPADKDDRPLRFRNENSEAAWRSPRASKGQTTRFSSRDWMMFCHCILAAAFMVEPFEPRTYEEAKNSTSWTEWKDAMGDEVKSLRLNKTWRLKKRSSVTASGKHILRGRWVFKIKRAADGSVQKYKARWVVRGFEQVEGSDYAETFAAVVKPMSYKALFAIAAAMDYEIEQMDVKTAFLYGNVDDEVYVEQPVGYEEDPDSVCQLDKALYGLKQSPRIWYDTLTKFLRSLGFEALNADLSVFTRNGMIIAIYVDDLLIAGPSKNDISEIKRALNGRFQMSDLGPCTHYLGISVRRDRANRSIYLSQRGYIEKFLKDLGMWDVKTAVTPLDSSRLPEAPQGYQAADALKSKYQRAVGLLMYAMLGTRPDIAYAVSVVSRFSANPTTDHWLAVQRILRYLRGTLDLELAFSGDLRPLVGYSDADWAGDISTRRSTSGYVFSIGTGPISWSSKRQSTVSLSTCEAEYIGQTQATKEAVWLRNLLAELTYMNERDIPTTIIYGDNQGAIALAKNPKFHGRSKHIDIQHHYVREKVEDRTVGLKYIETSKQIADGLTKPLSKVPFLQFRKALGLQ